MSLRSIAVLLFLLLSIPATGQQVSPCARYIEVPLGPHRMYGRGCAACHAPHVHHAEVAGSASEELSRVPLWGSDLKPAYDQTFDDGGAFPLLAPAGPALGIRDPMMGLVLCLSCHDGNLAGNGMAKGITYESIPHADGYVPTHFHNYGTRNNAVEEDHPVGREAKIGCGGAFDWDCLIVNGQIIAPPGSNFARFQQNYGFTVAPAVIDGNPVVTCTSCHDQHSQQGWQGEGRMSTRCDVYKTQFFVRGYYDPSDPASNSAAQFCRNCHADKSNEMHNAAIPTI